MVLRAKWVSGLGRATLSDVRIRFTRGATYALERPAIVVFLFALAVRLGMAAVTGLWWEVSFLDDGAQGHMPVAPPLCWGWILLGREFGSPQSLRSAPGPDG